MTKPKPKPTTNRELAAALTRLDEKFLNCRDSGLRHPWEVITDFHVPVMQTEGKAIRYIDRSLMCSRCGTEKIEHYVMTRSGMDKQANTYHYPEGYQLPGIPRGVKPSSIVAQEQYRRALAKVAHAANGERETGER